jgi:hypothetical protein
MSDEDVQLPLSGAVAITQSLFPITVNVGRSGSQATEKDVISVASYGRQLGRIGDALMVLIKRVDLKDLTPEEANAIGDLKCMLYEIAKKKKR